MCKQRTDDLLADYKAAAARESRRSRARQAKAAEDVMADVMLRRGYGRMMTHDALRQAWQDAAGPLLAKSTAAVAIRRKRLEVVADSSTTVQELTFLRETILARLQKLLPHQTICDLKVRVGPLS